jgi:hypothetical protein
VGDVTKIDDAYLWNITRIAQAFGVSRDTVRKRLNAAGVSSVKKVKGVPLYPLPDVGPALFAGEANVMPTEYKPNELHPKDRKDYFQSEIARLTVEEKTKQLIPVEDVRADQVRTFKANVAFFEGLTDKMERTRLFNPEQLDALERATDTFRDQLYNELMDVADE